MVYVGIIDDDKLIRTIVQKILDSDPAYKVSFEIDSISDLYSLPKTQVPNVVLLDIQMPDIDGIEGIQHVLNLYPKTKIIMLTAMIDKKNIVRALQNGAFSYLNKENISTDIKKAIEDALNGKSNLSQSAMNVLVNYLRESRNILTVLSSREQEIALCLVDNLSYKEISDKLQISIDTVRTHIKKIYSKLMVNKRKELIEKIKSNT
ncbi:response regulator transcription factor [Olivibacter sitiensis]|uniref:response regulator transcription factor n=1 Tax=Olivibacter sitiensis TaxID=376470 RepID=UPI0004827A48|nr:response regulator transcription factor [Olivibacter sitiensis]